MNSLFKILYKNAAASLIVSGGSYDSNTIYDGAVFDLTESDSFLSNEAYPDTFPDGNSFANLYITSSASFASNSG